MFWEHNIYGVRYWQFIELNLLVLKCLHHLKPRDNNGRRISFTRNGTTFKGSSLDGNLGFSKIDNVLTGGVNIDTGGQAQDPSVNESRSHEQNHSMTSDLANIASELAIGLISSGQEKKSEEEDFAPRKKRGPRL